MNLVIVESPTKAKTISKFLGDNYQVGSSYGHVRDLPKSKLGIDVEHHFEPSYIIPLKARPVIKNLKSLLKKSDKVVLATDEDREGEAIAWHLFEALKLNEAKIKEVDRIVFHEITKSAIAEALKNPRTVDLNLVDAQQARRVLDRLVGYKLSPFLWKKVVGGLSAGRVQSVTVRLIAERENEIRNFKPEEYWTIIADLSKSGGDQNSLLLEATLFKIRDKTLEKFDIKNKESAEKIAESIRGQKFQIAKVEKKSVKKNPPPPFITSTLQQEAVKRLGFSSKKTMFIAQRLYEHGLITYMRTDSVNLSQESLAAAKQWLETNLGKNYAIPSPRTFVNKSRLAQEAHEAIRPTEINKLPEELGDESDKKLYKLIWQRFLASQMPPAELAVTALEISGDEYGFKANGQQIIFDGYLKIWPQKFSEVDLPSVEEGEFLELKDLKPIQHFTEPPPRYSEASLIKTLEEYGIGRPSTYAPIIAVIQLRNYAKKEKGRFYITEIGELVNKVLTEHFPEIVDIGFTAKMEENLDEIAQGEKKWQSVIADFYTPFSKNLESKYAEVSKKDLVQQEATDEKCDKCGKPMVIKFGRFGKFLACSGFPECKSTKPLQQKVKEEPKKIGMACPKCGVDSGGEIVERRVSRGRARGKIFWGCSRYPDCDYASWTDPRNPPENKEDGKDKLSEKK